jgi:hypothetical protein
MKINKEKGPIIFFGQFVFLDCPLKLFLVGPPNHTFHPLVINFVDGIEYFQTNKTHYHLLQ